MNKKVFALSTSIVLGVSTILNVGAVMATETNEITKNFEFKKAENEITGKITSIDATNVVIQVAIRKEMKKPEGFGKGNRPEMTDEMKQKMQNGEKPEGFGKGNRPEMTEEMKQKMQNSEKSQTINMDEFFTLTGETKTINIATADLGKNMDFSDFKPEDNQNQDQKQKMEDMFKNAKAKTYQDYKIGDYITIECTDATYKTAKTVREGRMMGQRGGFRGFGGKDFKKNDENKQ